MVSRRVGYSWSRRFFDFIVGSPCSLWGGSLYCRVIIFIVEWASLLQGWTVLRRVGQSIFRVILLYMR